MPTVDALTADLLAAPEGARGVTLILELDLDSQVRPASELG